MSIDPPIRWELIRPWLMRIIMHTYTAINQKLLKTGCNNVVGATLFNVVNNIVRHWYTWLRANSGSTILFNIVDNQEQCCPNNIVASCFPQPVTTYTFLPCSQRLLKASLLLYPSFILFKPCIITVMDILLMRTNSSWSKNSFSQACA